MKPVALLSMKPRQWQAPCRRETSCAADRLLASALASQPVQQAWLAWQASRLQSGCAVLRTSQAEAQLRLRQLLTLTTRYWSMRVLYVDGKSYTKMWGLLLAGSMAVLAGSLVSACRCSGTEPAAEEAV